MIGKVIRSSLKIVGLATALVFALTGVCCGQEPVLCVDIGTGAMDCDDHHDSGFDHPSSAESCDSCFDVPLELTGPAPNSGHDRWQQLTFACWAAPQSFALPATAGVIQEGPASPLLWHPDEILTLITSVVLLT